jgi:hypothetical protein
VSNVARINPIRVTNDTRPWTDRNGDLIPQLDELGASTGFNLGTTNRYAETLERPYTNEFSVEVEQQLAGSVVVAVGFFNRATKRNIGSKNLAVPLESYIPLNVREVTSGRDVTVYNQDPALRGRFDVLWDNYPELDTLYRGVDLTFNKRMSNRWMLMGGVSVGRNEGDIYGTSDLNNPNFTFRHGIIGNDVPVSLRASGVYQLPWGISLSASAQRFRGFPENTTVLVSADTVKGLTQVSQSLVVEPRATTRLPNVNSLDIGIRKMFELRGVRVEPIVDIYNALNGASIVARTTQLGPTYGQAANIQRGLLIRAGFNLNF